MSTMSVKYIITCALLVFSVIDDLCNGRIRNSTVLAGLVAGLAVNFAENGLRGLVDSMFSAFIPAAILFALFVLRMLGAGDIKLFCSIGSVMGVKFLIRSMALSFIAGGLIAAAIMLVRKNVLLRFNHMANYFRSIYLLQSFTPYTDLKNNKDGAKFPFALAIAAGCGMQAILGIL